MGTVIGVLIICTKNKVALSSRQMLRLKLKKNQPYYVYNAATPGEHFSEYIVPLISYY